MQMPQKVLCGKRMIVSQKVEGDGSVKACKMLYYGYSRKVGGQGVA